eukprot:EG_transcript_2758
MRHPLAVGTLLGWLLLCGTAGFFAWRFLVSWDTNSTPVGDLRGDKGGGRFGDTIDNDPIIILVSALQHQSISKSAVIRTFSEAAAAKLLQYEGVKSVAGYFLPPHNRLLQEQYIRNDTYTLLVVDYDGNATADCVYFIQNQVIDVLRPPAAEFQVEMTGLPVLVMDMASATIRDLERMDAVTIPLAILVLGVSLRRASLLVLPLLTIAVAIVVTFALFDGVKLWIPVPTFVASTVMSIVVALCIDYSLFLCSRYNEALAAGAGNVAAVWQAVRGSGENILVSGSTIAMAFLGLAVFPVTQLRSQGLTACIGVVVTVAANLTLIPAMLLCFGGFFGPKPHPWWQRLFRSTAPPAALPDDVDDCLPAAAGRPAKLPPPPQQSLFFRFAKYTAAHPWRIIVAVLVLGLPFLFAALNLQLAFNLTSFSPRNSPASQTLRHLQEVWGHGAIDPYFLTVDTRRPRHVRSPQFWNASRRLLEYLGREVPEVPLDRFNSVRMAQGRFVEPIIRDFLLRVSSTEGVAYQTLWNRTVDAEETSMLILIAVPFDGFAQVAVDWARHTRDALRDFQTLDPTEAGGYTLTLTGGASSQVDMLDEVWRDLPLMGGLTFGIIVLIVAVAFRSLILPLAFILAMCYTLGVTFGLAVMVFGPLQWTIPVMSFSITCGLALDYGVFLLTRVREFRRAGYFHEAAVIKGVHRTGGVITSAGVIMFIALGGLMLSEEPALNQFGLLLCFSVLLDTFIIRCAFVPALLTLTGEATWWPSAMPEPHRGVEEVDGLGLLGLPDTDDDAEVPHDVFQ